MKQRRKWKQMPGILCAFALMLSLIPSVPARAEGMDISGTGEAVEMAGETTEESAEDAETVAADGEAVQGGEEGNTAETVSGLDAGDYAGGAAENGEETADTHAADGSVSAGDTQQDGEQTAWDSETGSGTESENGTETDDNEGNADSLEAGNNTGDNGVTGADSGGNAGENSGTEAGDSAAPDKETSTGTTDGVETAENGGESADNGENPDGGTSGGSAETGQTDTGNEEPDTAIPTASGSEPAGISSLRLPVMLLSTPAAYTDAEGNIFTYTLDDDGNATITGITVSGSSLVIPDTIAGAAVIAVSGERVCVVTNPGVRIPYLYIDCETVGIRAFAGLDIGTLVIGEHVGRFPYYDAGTYDYVWGQFAGTKVDSLVLNAVELLTGIATPSSGEYAIVTPFSGAEIGAFEIGSGVKLIPENFLRNAVMELDSLTINTERIGAYAFGGGGITINELVIGTGVKAFEEYSNSLSYKHYWSQFSSAKIGTLKLYAQEAALSYWQEKGLTNEVCGPFYLAQVGALVIGGDVAAIPDYFLCNAVMSLDDFTLNTPKIGASAFAGGNIRFGTLTIGKDVAEYRESQYSTGINHFWRQFAGCRIGKLVYGADRATVVNNVGSLTGTIFNLYGPFENAVISDLSIQGNVVRLSDYLFYNAAMELDELTLEVPVVGGMAFMGSNIHIGKLTIAEDVTAFALAPHSNSTFSHWEQFSQATIGELVFLPTSLNISASDVYVGYGYGPFRSGKAGKLTLGAQVADIPAYCFKDMYLTQDALALHAKTIGTSAFQSANISIGTLTVGAELERFGYTASGSLLYFNQFADMKAGTVKYCPKEAQTAASCYKGIFENTQVSALEIDGAVEKIPNFLFYNAKLGLSDFTLNVPLVGYGSFSSKNNRFQKLTVGADVTTFLTNSSGNSLAFNNCTIESLDYNAVSAQLDGLTSNVYGPFADGCVVRALSVADSVKVIPYGCFRGAKIELPEVTIQNADIGYAAFYGSNIKIGTLNIGKGAGYTGKVSSQLGNFSYAQIGVLNYNSNSIDPVWTVNTTSYGMFANAVIGQLNIGGDVEVIPSHWFYHATLTQDTLTIPCAWGPYAFYGSKKDIGTLVLNGDFAEIPSLDGYNNGFVFGKVGTVVYDIPAAGCSPAQRYSIFHNTEITNLVIGERVTYLDGLLFNGVEVEDCTVYPVEAKSSHKLQTLTQTYLPKSDNLHIHYNSDFKPYFEEGASEESWLCADYYDKSYGEKLYDEETGEYSIEVLNTCSVCGHVEHGTEEADMTYNLYLSIPLDIPLSFNADGRTYSGSAEVYAYGRLGNAYEGIRLVADTDAENFGTAVMGGNTYDVSEYLSVGFTSGTAASFDGGELSDNAGILEAGGTEGLSVEQMNVSVDGIAFMQGGAGEWQIPVPVKILIER